MSSQRTDEITHRAVTRLLGRVGGGMVPGPWACRNREL